MSDTFETIHDMWAKADQEDKLEYLFRALVCSHKEIVEKITTMNRTCECRAEECDNKYLTKKQAKWAVLGLMVFIAGIAFGGGYLTFKEVLSHATKVVF